MKIKIEIDESAAEDEVIIRCRGLTKQVAAVQRAVRDVTNASERFYESIQIHDLKHGSDLLY